MANSRVPTDSEIATLSSCISSSQPGNRSSAQEPNAARPALTESDTINRKATPRISPNDTSRVITRARKPLGRSSTGTCQMRSSALCSSANTVVAPISTTTTLTSPATRPLLVSLAAFTRPCTTSAPSGPIRPLSCATIWPVTASRPNTAPAIAITITSSGASENTV